MFTFLDRFRDRSGSKTVVGLELRRNGVALVARSWKKDVPVVEALDFVAVENLQALDHAVKPWVDRHKLNKATCHVVLNPEDYQMLLVEPPDVPDEEIRAAIRWRLKDLITLSPDKVSIDVFHLPEDGTKANKKMVYVVVTETEKLKQLIAAVHRTGLKLATVDVCELAIRNVVVRLLNEENTGRGAVVVRIRQGVGSVYIYRQGNMYLARSFSLGYNAGLLDELPQENLALEIQRSLDYFERQMGQAPPSAIYVCGDHISDDKVGPTLKASLSLPLYILQLSGLCAFPDDCDQELLPQCIGALGAALRQEAA